MGFFLRPRQFTRVEARDLVMQLRRARKIRRWTREIRPTVTLALPIMAGMVSQTLLGLADTVMVGKVGVIELAAASFVNTVIYPPLVFCLGLLTSLSVLTARAFGAGDRAEAGEVLRHGLAISMALGLLLGIGCYLFRPFLGYLGQPAEVVAASGTYFLLFGWSMIPAMFAHGCKQFSEALNKAWGPNFILLGGVVLNVWLNWILIYGNWGAPALGLEGAGWATLIARVATAAAMFAFIMLHPLLREFHPPRWLPRLRPLHLKNQLGLGWPVAVQHLLEVSAFAFAALMMGWISAEAMAAHQIALTCAATTFMFCLGLGMAVSIRVGQAWGAGQFTRLRRIGFLGLILSTGIMGVFALMFLFWRFPIARAFVNSPEVIALTAQLFLIAAFFQIVDGLQVTAISALRGLADVRVPALIAVLAYWIIAVPAGYFFGFPASMGAVGIWIGLAAGIVVAAACLSWRFHRMSRTPARTALSAGRDL